MKSRSEWFNSLAIGLAAIVALFVWLRLLPQVPDALPKKEAGETLFDSFTDPTAMAKLTITRVNPETGLVESLELDRKNDQWVIHSLADAPADNPARMSSVVAPLLALTVLDRTSDASKGKGKGIESSGENSKAEKTTPDARFREYGLLDPKTALAAERDRTGILLEISGENGEQFVRLLLGDRPEESSAVRDIHYVRIPNRDEIFTVDFSGESAETAGQEKPLPYAERLSLNPLDWMNRDLLRISRWNIVDFSLLNVVTDADGKTKPTLALTVRQDPERPINRVWELRQRIDFSKEGQGIVAELDAPDTAQGPNNPRINDAADSLGHLSFSALERKPDDLAERFRAAAPIRDFGPLTEELKSLGFVLLDHDPRQPESTDPLLTGEGGELRLAMKDGIEITVLFGLKREDGLRRLLVTAGLDENSIRKPEEIPIPDGVDEKERTRITSENALRQNEYSVNLAEGQKKAGAFGRRFDDWFYLISEEDYQKILPKKSDLFK